jgi:asparagine synthase (glutamine-hydrolysing)
MVAATSVLGSRTSATSADLVRDAPALLAAQDEPIPSTGPYSHWRVMALARQAGIKVLLDGQGSDEILAGYPYQLGPFLAEQLRRHGVARALQEARAAADVTRRPLGFFLGLLAYHALPWPRALRERMVGRFATHSHLPPEALEPELLRRVGRIPGGRHVRRSSLEAERRANLLETSLPALLRYEDRNSMAFGIEARTPFLDYRVVEAALALPAEQLIARGWSKATLREAARSWLPESVRLRRDKLGFSTPERRWLGEIGDQIREWLRPPSYVSTLVRRDVLERWLAEPTAALARRRGLWRLIAVELWRRHLDSFRAPA